MRDRDAHGSREQQSVLGVPDAMDDNVLRTSTEVQERLENGRLDGCLVTDVDLSKKGLPSARVADVTMRRVGLQDAKASGGDFSRVKITESSCRGANFGDTLFRGCSFFGSELIEATFTNALLNSTAFYTTRLGNADFSGARLQGCTFNTCELFGVRFARALLMNTRFEAQDRGNVTLDRADFSNAVLIDSDLLGANLFGANFENALLVKVDLRHANLTQANFTGARLVDVQLSMAQLEPPERRQVETAIVDDPWRKHGFMKDVFSAFSVDELSVLMELFMRTYVIEGAQPASGAESFAGTLANLKSSYDFPELEHLRVHGTTVQVRTGHTWSELGADAPVANHPAPGPALASSGAPPSPMLPAETSPTPAPTPRPAPKNVKRSKRFRKLEMD